MNHLSQFSLDEIRRKANRFQQKIRWRNAREYVAALIVIAAFGWHGWTVETVLARIGHGLIIAGTVYVVHRLRSRGAARPPPLDAVPSIYVAFHRRELERQRDLLRTVWQWYLGPLVPGLLVLFTNGAIEAAAKGSSHLLRAGISVAICVLVFFGVGWLNKTAARKLEAEIRALDSSGT